MRIFARNKDEEDSKRKDQIKSDIEIIRKIADGDISAIDKLYKKSKSYIVNSLSNKYRNSHLGVFGETIDDLFHDALASLYNNIVSRKFLPEDLQKTKMSLNSFLYRDVENHIKSLISQEANRWENIQGIAISLGVLSPEPNNYFMQDSETELSGPAMTFNNDGKLVSTTPSKHRDVAPQQQRKQHIGGKADYLILGANNAEQMAYELSDWKYIVHRTVDNMSDECNTILRRQYLFKEELGEIPADIDTLASDLDKPYDNIKMQKHRCMRRLKTLFMRNEGFMSIIKDLFNLDEFTEERYKYKMHFNTDF